MSIIGSASGYEWPCCRFSDPRGELPSILDVSRFQLNSQQRLALNLPGSEAQAAQAGSWVRAFEDSEALGLRFGEL